jgi:hypothetical protein
MKFVIRLQSQIGSNDDDDAISFLRDLCKQTSVRDHPEFITFFELEPESINNTVSSSYTNSSFDHLQNHSPFSQPARMNNLSQAVVMCRKRIESSLAEVEEESKLEDCEQLSERGSEISLGLSCSLGGAFTQSKTKTNTNRVASKRYITQGDEDSSDGPLDYQSEMTPDNQVHTLENNNVSAN